MTELPSHAPGCERVLPHESPAQCWRSGLGLPRLSAFVDLDREDFAERTPAGDWNHDPDAPVGEFAGVETIVHRIAISDEMALDLNLLEPGTPAYEAAMVKRRAADERMAAWRRSWPGRRARARAAVRERVHAVRHALAHRLDPECWRRDDDG